MKKQEFSIFVKKSLRMNMLKIKDVVKLSIIVIMQVDKEVLNITYVD